ncbi:HlyD family secretion protein [Aurantimonas sp. Leaf443]|uniref:HlyD family secretion protein n=1 Tax=Aurantimonas sp. Leaf443 TaxID=1736378 RepID=UPI0009E72ED8|nr:HlyD family secretion protein [Aurantimonas sp. Leaf443]
MNASPEKTQIETAEALAKTPPAGTRVEEDATAAPEAAARRRRPLRMLLMVGLPLALVVGGAYFWVTGGRYVNTEDAYVQQDRVTVMPQVSGQIASVAVAENQAVRAGQPLFAVDDATYRNAVEQAEAELQSARLEVEKMKAAYRQAVTGAQTAREALDTAQTSDDRQRALIKSGVVSQASADQTALTLQQARGSFAQAEQAVLSAKAALAGDPEIPIDRHPDVLQALATLHGAELDLARAQVVAPEDGLVSQTDRLQVGQYVTPATAVMSLVETGGSYVEANYKETEITEMRVGQPVEVELDTYPGRPIPAVIGSIGAGTGSEFAILPAQNATGNWVKVVQRIPVRIDLRPGPDAPPLRAGMSASVTVDIGHARGAPKILKRPLEMVGLGGLVREDAGIRASQAATDLNAAPQAAADALPATVASRERAALDAAPALPGALVETEKDGAAAPALPGALVETEKDGAAGAAPAAR